MRKLLAVVVLPCLVALGGCGSSSSSSTSSTSTTTGSAAGPASGPSKQARMICAPEAAAEIVATLGVPPTAPVVGRWTAPDYACTYTYRNGSFRLVVRDLPTKAATAAYFTQLARTHGRASSVNVGADEAALLKDGSLVARKDRHVLLVDASHLPAQFGQPPMMRSQVAYSIAGVIMSCWKGDAS